MEVILPTTQVLSIVFFGFVIGALTLHYFLKRPLAFALAVGLIFYGLRIIPASLNVAPAVEQAGNLISGAVMWAIYIASMLLGYFVVQAKWGVDPSTNESTGTVNQPK